MSAGVAPVFAAVAVDSGHADRARRAGLAVLTRRRSDDVVAHVQRALRRADELAGATKQLPTNAGAWTTLGDAYQQLHRYAAARD